MDLMCKCQQQEQQIAYLRKLVEDIAKLEQGPPDFAGDVNWETQSISSDISGVSELRRAFYLLGSRCVVSHRRAGCWVLVWLIHCLVVPLFGSSIIWLFHCLVVLWFGCSIIWLFHYLIVRYLVVPWFSYSTILLFHQLILHDLVVPYLVVYEGGPLRGC